MICNITFVKINDKKKLHTQKFKIECVDEGEKSLHQMTCKIEKNVDL